MTQVRTPSSVFVQVWAVVIALTAWNFYTAGIDGGVNYAFFGFGTHCGGTADVHNAPCASARDMGGRMICR